MHALLLVAVLCPVLAIVSLGHLAPRRLLWWTGGVAVLDMPADAAIEPGAATLTAFWWP